MTRKSDEEQQTEVRRVEEMRRTEIAMLKMLAEKYPAEAEKFARRAFSNENSRLTKSFS